MAIIRMYYISTTILLALSHVTNANLPDDIEPRRITSQTDAENYLVFRGTSEDLKSIGSLKEVQNVVFLTKNEIAVTAKDKFYLIDVSSLSMASSNDEIFSKQQIDWSPSNATLATCHPRATRKQDCQNYIRVVQPLSNNSVLICGTNAMAPQCMVYEWNDGRFTGNKFALTDSINKKVLPKNKEKSLAYTYSDGNMYTQFSQAVYRTPVSAANINWGNESGSLITSFEEMPHLEPDTEVFERPRFVGSVDIGDKILFFFREVAKEQYSSDEMEYSRVGQVCKTDRGGPQSLLDGKWTSIFKARLNCSVPGERPFYFNDIQHISEVVMVNGQKTIFATMTTPKNSIRGSAICAFTLDSINKTFNGAFFKTTTQTGGMTCFSGHEQQAPSYPSHPSMCPAEDDDTRKLSIERLNFRRRHVLLKGSVQSITGRPLFMETSSRHVITAIAIDQEVTPTNNFTFMYLGTSDGRLLKVLSPMDQSETVLSEEIFAFHEKKCFFGSKKDRKVLQVISVANENSILTVFENCIVSVPKHRCPDFSCKTSCVQSGNPYCGWHGDKCVHIATVAVGTYEQDLFAKTNMTSCDDETSQAVGIAPCGSGSFTSTIIPIIVCVAFAILVVIVVVFYRLQRKPRIRNRKHLDTIPNNVSKPTIGSYTVENSSTAALIRNDSNSSRRIYTGPRNEIKQPSDVSSLGRNPSFGRQAPSVPPPLPPSQDGKKMNIPKEASYESLKSVSSHSSGRGRKESRTSNGSNDSVRSFHGVNIVQNFKNIKTSPPPQRNNQSANNNNNQSRKIIGIATAMSRNESPVRRRCLSSQEDEFKDIKSTESSKKSKSFRNPKITNYEAEKHNKASENSQRRSLPSPQTIIVGDKTKPTGPPMVTHYQIVSDATSIKSQTSEEPDYANIVTPDQPCVKPQKPPAKPERKLSSFTNSHFNTAWYPVNAQIDEQTSQSESGFGSGSLGGSSSETLNKAQIVDHVKPVDHATERFVQPPQHLAIKNRNNPELKKEESPSNFYSEVVNPDGAIPIHYVDDSAFFDGKNGSSDDDIMRDLEEIMQRSGCKKQSTTKRKKTKKKKSPCENEVRFFNMIDRMNASGLPYVLSDEDHIYETPCNLELSQQSTDDFSLGKSNTEQSSGNNFAFHTMRPPGRRRQKLPRLRNSEKDESKPLAVPTPVIPM